MPPKLFEVVANFTFYDEHPATGGLVYIRRVSLVSMDKGNEFPMTHKYEALFRREGLHEYGPLSPFEITDDIIPSWCSPPTPQGCVINPSNNTNANQPPSPEVPIEAKVVEPSDVKLEEEELDENEDVEENLEDVSEGPGEWDDEEEVSVEDGGMGVEEAIEALGQAIVAGLEGLDGYATREETDYEGEEIYLDPYPWAHGMVEEEDKEEEDDDDSNDEDGDEDTKEEEELAEVPGDEDYEVDIDEVSD